MLINTVLGTKNIDLANAPTALSHEHIAGFSYYLRMMSADYFDCKAIEDRAVSILKSLKSRHGLGLFCDCSAINIGRDTELLKRVSERSGVDIVCSTGFYYNDEPVMFAMSEKNIAEIIIEDAINVNAGIIKAAVENTEPTDFNYKLLKAAAIAHIKLRLPIVLHTNASNKNGIKAVKFLLDCGVAPQWITAAHLSDTEDNEYIKSIAEIGCFIGLDRLYKIENDEYINSKINQILNLCEAGYEDRIVLSHDDSVFQGFDKIPRIISPRYEYVFDYILPRLNKNLINQLIRINPLKMLNPTATE